MVRRSKIKVIKKGETKPAESVVAAEEKPATDNTNQLTSTVSNWIDEFQRRRRQETESAREQFYS
ncbi:MAG TPA: hypothetical protein VIL74_11765 [Pyrinomonadaceae bacterium]|jgi:hypothetical protein